jgi:manganese/zinc/iron transport system permease protein
MTNLQTVTLGLGVLGGTVGAIGSLVVVRKQGLQGDAISHAALPGVALAFVLGAVSPWWVAVGGAVAGWLAMWVVGAITRNSRLPFDSALAGALAVFFGFGLVLMTYLQKLVGREPNSSWEQAIKPNAQEALRQGLDRYLFGQAALISFDDVILLAGFGLVAGLLIVLFWKDIQLVCFDVDFARSLGRPVGAIQFLLTTLLVFTVVLGLRSVGVVLMSALLIAPTVAARAWTSRLSRLVILAGLFGVVSGLGGVLLSHYASGPTGTLPTGPTVVLMASALTIVSLAFGVNGGWFTRPRVASAPLPKPSPP